MPAQLASTARPQLVHVDRPLTGRAARLASTACQHGLSALDAPRSSAAHLGSVANSHTHGSPARLASTACQHCSSAWDAQAVRQRSSTAHSAARLDSAARPHGMSAKFGGTARPHRLSARVILSFMVVDLGSSAPQHTAQQLSLAAQAGSTLGRAAPPPCERFTCLPAFEPHGRARRTLTQTCRPSGSRRGGGTTHRGPPAPPLTVRPHRPTAPPQPARP